MTTKKKIRPTRRPNVNQPRYTTGRPAASSSEEVTEQSWIIFALAFFLLLGVAFISAISYILLLG